MAGGFRPVQDISGGSYTGKVQTYSVAAGHSTLLAVGDLVRITGTANSDGLAQVDAAAAGQLITGPIVGIDFNVSDIQAKGLAAGTAGTVKVATDPMILLEAESSTTVAVTDVGGNAEIVASVATASGGLVNSNMTVNTGTVIAGTAQIRIEGLKDGGTAAGTTLYCRINESTTNTVGI
jgi:hypothetical protein|tara:strand:- start:170 stop:706 length:537 start_codon:yes stop_codon:yes gene_type:complete